MSAKYFLLFLVSFSFAVFSACGEGSGSEDESCWPGTKRCDGYSTYSICNAEKSWGESVNCQAGEKCSEGECVTVSDDGDSDADSPCSVGDLKCVGELISQCDENGEWLEPGTCPSGKVCYGDACVDTSICQADVQKRCASDHSLQTCNSEGDGWLDPVECAEDEVCLDNDCQSVDCEPGDTACNSEGKVVTCNLAGNSWEDPQECDGSKICSEGRCIGSVCRPGMDYQCSGRQRIRYCNTMGDGWNAPQDCPEGEVCLDEFGCVNENATVCVADSFSCEDEHTIRQCNSDGSGYLPEKTPCEAGDAGYRCIDGQCLDLCAQAVLSDSYMGCDYWPVVTPNPQLDRAFKKGEESEFAVVVSNTNDTYTAHISIEIPGKDPITREVAPQNNVTVRLPYYELQGSARQKFAWHLGSDIPVTVTQFNPLTYLIDTSCYNKKDDRGECYSYTNDASLLLPEHVLGREYMVLAYTPLVEGSQSWGGDWSFEGEDSRAFISIVATAEGQTTVTVKAAGEIAAGVNVEAIKTGEEKTFTLEQHEVLQLVSDHTQGDPDTCYFSDISSESANLCLGSDLTGTVVTSDNPVAVYTGNECQFVPHIAWACDHMEEQLFPTSSWASQYIAGRMKPTQYNHKNIYKILALSDGTELDIRPADVVNELPEYAGDDSKLTCARTLNAGETCMIETDRDFVVLSGPGNRVLLGEFIVGQCYDAYEYEDCSAYGDPSYILVPPVEQYRKQYVFLTPDTYNKDYINILAKSADVEILLDGQPLTSSFDQVEGINAFVLRKQIDDGTHVLTASSPVGLIVYGYDEFVSYAYPAGLDLYFMPH